MKIRDVRVLRVDPSGRGGPGGHTFVQVESEDGPVGLGECSAAGVEANHAVIAAIRRLRELLVGKDASDIGLIWHTIFRRFTFLGSRGFATTLASGIDIALWDLAGKALGRPVYKLLGGAFRESVPLYANNWFVGCNTPEEYAAAAKTTVALGFSAMKFDPFRDPPGFETGITRRPYTTGMLPLRSE